MQVSFEDYDCNAFYRILPYKSSVLQPVTKLTYLFIKDINLDPVINKKINRNGCISFPKYNIIYLEKFPNENKKVNEDNNLYESLTDYVNKNPDEINKVDKNGWSVLHFLCLLSHIKNYNEEIKILIDRGADLNLQTNDGLTPLMIACNSIFLLEQISGFGSPVGMIRSAHLINNFKTIELLITKGANVNLQSDLGFTALMYACHLKRANNIEPIELLIKNNANLDLQNNYGNTALFFACYSKQKIELIELLIKNNANLDLQNGGGNTALMLAILFLSLDIIKLLIDSGARLDFKNNEGETALTIAKKESQNKEIYELLLKHYSIIEQQKIHMQQISKDIQIGSREKIYRIGNIRYMLLCIKHQSSIGKYSCYDNLTNDQKDFLQYYYAIYDEDSFKFKFKDLLKWMID